MKTILSLGCILTAVPVFASTAAAADVGHSLPRLGIQLLMLFAMLLLAIASRQISRVR
jgi:hypothetical protein